MPKPHLPVSPQRRAANPPNAATSTGPYDRRPIEEFDRLKALREELPNEPIIDVDLEQTKPLIPIPKRTQLAIHRKKVG